MTEEAYGYEKEQEVLLAWACRIKVPEGFTMEGPDEDSEEKYAYDRSKGIPPNERFVLKLASDDIKLKFDIGLQKPEERTNFEGEELYKAFELDGHTSFKTKDGWFTFDQRGIGDSFYGNDEDDPNEIIARQIKKSREAIDRHKGEVKVPGFPISAYVSEKEKKKIALKLVQGESHIFAPGGMGTAYEIYFGNKRSRWDVVLAPETAAFFGFPKLCAAKLDWD